MSVPPDAPGEPLAAGPCVWPVSYDNCLADPVTGEPGLPPVLAQLSDEQRLRFEQMATDYLAAWTGLGLCPASVRPCRSDCTSGRSTFGLPVGGAPFSPVLLDGAWINPTCGRCGDRCSCSHTPTIRLPGPVHSVQQVLVDGQLLSGGAYRVDNHRLLVRTDGLDWPTCQQMDRPPTEPDTFLIDYTRGTEVPFGGQAAAGVLTEEFAKAYCRDSSCQLPRRVQSITRQGVTVAVLDAFDDIDTGHTGIWVIDAWVASVTKPRPGSRVLSPDRPRERHRYQTWP